MRSPSWRARWLSALAAPAGAATAPTPVTQASTSTRGVSASTINVVFPLISFSSIEGEFEIESDAEYGEQTKAIHLFVNQINDAGGINGRKINPMIVSFDPTNPNEQQALCKQWTQGSPPVFAVVDGLGTWEGVNELCVTQQGHTPMLSQWTTTTNWTDLGSPYLWWTGADDAGILAATVQWGLSSGRLGHGQKVGVVVSDEVSDQDALNSSLLPDLKKIGVDPQVVTVTADVGETATTDSDATLAVERLKAAGVQDVIPLLPENAFTPYIGAETSQEYFPKLLLSDYQSEIEVALGLIPIPYDKALNGQEGVTAETLGGIDLPVPEAQGGYDPGVRSCWTVWHKAYPQTPKGNINDDIEEQGPVQGLVPGDPPLRQGGHHGRQGPQPADLRRGDVAHHELPRRVLARPELRTGQVLRAHAVPRGRGPRQPPADEPVQARSGDVTAGGRLLGRRAELEAVAMTEVGPSLARHASGSGPPGHGRPRRSSRYAVAGSAKPFNVRGGRRSNRKPAALCTRGRFRTRQPSTGRPRRRAGRPG